MEKIVNTQPNIFNENKLNNKIAKITFMLCSLFFFMEQKAFAEDKSLKDIIVNVECQGQVAKNVELYCKGIANASYGVNRCKYLSVINSYQINNGGTSLITQVCLSFSDNSDIIYERLNPDYVPECCLSLSKDGSNTCAIGNSKDIYKHTLPNGKIMYSESNDPSRFSYMLPSKCEAKMNAMDILESMPEIGISRVDPNLIEY